MLKAELYFREQLKKQNCPVQYRNHIHIHLPIRADLRLIRPIFFNCCPHVPDRKIRKFPHTGTHFWINAESTAIAAAAAVPVAVKPIQMGLLASWAYAESIVELRTLFSGGKIAAAKTAESWTVRMVFAICFHRRKHTI